MTLMAAPRYLVKVLLPGELLICRSQQCFQMSSFAECFFFSLFDSALLQMNSHQPELARVGRADPGVGRGQCILVEEHRETHVGCITL